RRTNARREPVLLDCSQMWIESVELSHLPVGAPTQITVPGVPEIRVGDGLEPERHIETRRYLVGQALVLNEAVLSGYPDGLLVQSHCVNGSAFDASKLC